MAKEDLRIMKTKEKLSKALIVLLKEKGIKEIKISELCESAGVSRATFYNNFDSVEEVLFYYIEKIERPLELALERNLSRIDLTYKLSLPSLWKAFLFPIVAELERIKDDVAEIFDDDEISQELYGFILVFIKKSMFRIMPYFKTKIDLNVPEQIAVDYSAGGMCSLIFSLMKSGDRYTLEEKQYYVYHYVFEMGYSYYLSHNMVKGE